MRRFARPALLIALLVSASSAEDEDEFHRLSLTVSPVGIVTNVLQFVAEVQPLRAWSLAGMLEGGRHPGGYFGDWKREGWGVQVRHYPGLFGMDGLHAGLSTRFWTYEADFENYGARRTGTVRVAGPLLGYRFVSGAGFTFAVQLLYYQCLSCKSTGPEYAYVPQQIWLGEGEPKGGGPDIDIALGWSF